MPIPNAIEMSERIISVLKRRGPSLPVHVSKETGLSILFAGAFLSQLVSEKRIKISNMKVGSSPIYYLEEHSPMLEKFGSYLKSKEKEAFLLLKEKKFLVDREQTPAIRVALRAINDFAIPFNKNGEIIWRYYLVPESSFQEIFTAHVQQIPVKEKEIVSPVKEKEENEPEILVKKTPRPAKKPKSKKETKKTRKIDDDFFNKVKEWVSKNSMEILDIKSFNKIALQLKVKSNERELLLFAYNKKRITEHDLIKAAKKSSEFGLKYLILSFGEPQKKLDSLINSIRELSDIKKLE